MRLRDKGRRSLHGCPGGSTSMSWCRRPPCSLRRLPTAFSHGEEGEAGGMKWLLTLCSDYLTLFSDYSLFRVVADPEIIFLSCSAMFPSSFSSTLTCFIARSRSPIAAHA